MQSKVFDCGQQLHSFPSNKEGIKSVSSPPEQVVVSSQKISPTKKQTYCRCKLFVTETRSWRTVLVTLHMPMVTVETTNTVICDSSGV